MRSTTTIASIALGTILLGGCANHRQTHVFIPGVEARDWWYPSTDRNIGRFIQSDEVGRVAFNDQPSVVWPSGGSTLAASDALGSAAFYDTVAFAEAMDQQRRDAVASVPAD